MLNDGAQAQDRIMIDGSVYSTRWMWVDRVDRYNERYSPIITERRMSPGVAEMNLDI